MAPLVRLCKQNKEQFACLSRSVLRSRHARISTYVELLVNSSLPVRRRRKLRRAGEYRSFPAKRSVASAEDQEPKLKRFVILGAAAIRPTNNKTVFPCAYSRIGKRR